MNISIIAAIAEHNAIGYKNRLLCYLSADLKHFKKLTTGHTVIMGRRTFESLPNGALPKRTNIVISNTLHQPIDNSFIVKKTLETAIISCIDDDEIFFIGGSSIYKQSMKLANTLYITKIHAEFKADRFFPVIDEKEWKIVDIQDFNKDEKNQYDYSFIKYQRKNKQYFNCF